MELWDLYDLDRQRTGETMVRGDAMPPGRYHMVVHVCIINDRGEMLIQQRQPFKKGYPNLWDLSIGGSAVAGDTSVQAAEREVLEELGLTIHLEGEKPVMTIPWEHGFDDFYIVHMSPALTDLTLQPEEVKDACWADQAAILQMIADGRFVPYRPALIPLLFDFARGGEGAHQ